MMTTISFKNIVKSFIIGAVCVGFAGCSSRDEAADLSKTSLLIQGITIEQQNEFIIQESASVNKSVNAEQPYDNIFKDTKITSTKDFDVITNVTSQSTDNKQKKMLALSGKGNVNPTAAVTQSPILAGIKYRILIYDAQNNALVANVDATAGTSPNIVVDAGKNYKWYAISTNDTSTPTVDTTSGVIDSNILGNKDFLYAQGNINTVQGQNSMNIIFKHYTSQLTVDLDVRGMFAKIDNTTAIELGTGVGAGFTSIIQSGDFNIFTGLYSNLQNSAALTAANMVNKAGAGGNVGATKTATFYTAKTDALLANTLSLRFNTLNLTMDDASTRSFSPNMVVPLNNTTTIQPSIGYRTQIIARLIESGIKVSNILWARTNLYYAPNIPNTDKYRFHPDNEYTIENLLNITVGNLLSIQLNGAPFDVNNEYWNWMATTPTGTSGSGDPCGLVYPQGYWRMPTSAEFATLNANNTIGVNTVNPLLIGGSRIASTFELDGGQTSNTNYPTNSRKLFIPFFGYRTGNTIIDSPGSVSVLGLLVSGKAHYWSSTANGANANYDTRNYDAILGPVLGAGTPTIASGVRTDGRNIRCVRVSNTPNT
ncbi:hypothetical protein [Elizabethkingia anophelis]|uniref:hypothetical protein n=1 Tax=Elizabethkingia anophelis TaxID=1117645 RepID=UPI00136BB7BC|nr:hypothetical protein [Elizabethkingia anophelis]MYY43914.1 hypothetical protein [Elizabethkingia anophelis]